MDILRQLRNNAPAEDASLNETQLSATPVQVTLPRAASARPATVAARRFSPARTPLRNQVSRGVKSAFVGRISDAQPVAEDEDAQDTAQDTPSHVQIDRTTLEQPIELEDNVDVMGDEDEQIPPAVDESDHEEPELPATRVEEQDDEDEDETFQPPTRSSARKREPTAANSRKKRKSDAIETAIEATSSPVAKRAKRRSNDGLVSNSTQSQQKSPQQTAAKMKPPPKPRSRRPLQEKPSNTKLSARQEKQVEEAVQKIRARPGGSQRSLHVLVRERRETPADDTVARTRSGRISIKPLAFWRNEKCVYTAASDNTDYDALDGARFPLNAIDYVVRNDESVQRLPKRKGGKSKAKSKGKGRAQNHEDEDSADLDSDAENIDSDADEWELNSGTLKGNVATWDSENQVHNDEIETIDLAHSTGAIETKEVKGSTFRYAKLISTPFFGTGVVDLPAGGAKKSKNSRKMHMSFFVASGRVTVEVGPNTGSMTRFSIGKGGFWQVPRGEIHTQRTKESKTNTRTGNNYAIENEHGKNARIFFSQACEVAVE